MRLFEAAGLVAALMCGPPAPPLARAIGYGGAAGGGKSDADLALAVTWALAYHESSVAVFRRKFTDLEGPDGLVQRSHALLAPLRAAGRAEWNGGERKWRFVQRSLLKFCHCRDAKNVYDYQSQAFDLFVVDEATHFTWEMIDYLLTRNRPTRDWIPQSLAVFSTNPGNVGHLWFKSLFVDHPPEQPAAVTLPSGASAVHFCIPARLEDNPILDRRGGGAYRQTLLARDPATRRALLEGDWESFLGQAFGSWRREKHVCKPFAVPGHWRRWRAVDWGYASPFCCLAAAQDPDTGRVFVTHELYQRGLTDRAQARLIRERLSREHLPANPSGTGVPGAGVTYGDPSMWTTNSFEDRTFSTADEYAAEGVPLTKADNDRLTGKRKVDNLLEDFADGRPGLMVFETCPNLIRTLPALTYDAANVEDVDTQAEDHAYDCLRYLLSRVNPRPKRPAPVEPPAPDRIERLAGRIGWGSEDL